MIWQQYAKTLTDVLKLKGHIVSVSYTFDPPVAKRPKACRACVGMDQVHKGETIILDAGNSSCGGGTWHLGLGPQPQGKAAEGLKRFLVDGEKLVCGYAAFHRMAALATPPPRDVASTIVMAPMDKAEQACRLITLHTFFTGRTPRAELIGSHCHMAVAYSLVSGEVNVSFGDWTARQMIRSAQDLCWVTVPYHHLPNIIAAIPRCTAGTAESRPFSDYMSG
jgi:uncharacterized protein (DUF169 family)